MSNKATDLVRLLRPEQWTKNGFVLTGLLFGTQHFSASIFWMAIFAAVAFCFVSSCIYIINDLFDLKNDAAHPIKKMRPLPSGKVTVPIAWAFTILIGILGLLIGAIVSYKVLLFLIAYVILNVLYTLKLKYIEIVDVFCISLGFMLRIFAGTVGIGISPSNWLLLCGMMLTLFLGFSKRIAEIYTLKTGTTAHRRVLDFYSRDYLDIIITICASGVIMSYSLYTISDQAIALHQTENLIYTIPFVIYGLFRYIFLLKHREFGEDPANELIKDPHMTSAIAGWGTLVCYFLYVSI